MRRLADPPAPLDPFTAPAELDLVDRRIRSTVFSTGFSADFSWLRVPVLDARGSPMHTAGRSPIDGLWFLGFPWLRTRKSGIVWGAVEDSAEIVRQVVARGRSVGHWPDRVPDLAVALHAGERRLRGGEPSHRDAVGRR